MTDRPTQLRAIQNEALELFRRKFADYGDSFSQHGPTGIIIRLGDKLHRLQSITRTGVTLVNTETLRDTLIDMHNYAAMAVMLLDESKEAEAPVEPPKRPAQTEDGGENDEVLAPGDWLSGVFSEFEPTKRKGARAKLAELRGRKK